MVRHCGDAAEEVMLLFLRNEEFGFTSFGMVRPDNCRHAQSLLFRDSRGRFPFLVSAWFLASCMAPEFTNNCAPCFGACD